MFFNSYKKEKILLNNICELHLKLQDIVFKIFWIHIVHLTL